MFKALKKGIKKLGSTHKLQEEAGDTGQPVAAEGPVAAGTVGPPALRPPSPGLPPRPPSPLEPQNAADGAIGAQRTAANASAAAAALASAAAGSCSGSRPASPPLPPAAEAAAAASAAGPAGGQPEALLHDYPAAGVTGEQHVVDYELVAGHLELDTADALAAAAAAGLAGGNSGPYSHEDLQHHEQHEAFAHEHEQHDGRDHVCYDSAGPSGGSSAEEEAAAAAAAAAAAFDSSSDVAGVGADGASDRAGTAGISDALATVMYLTEDAEGGEDCVSVVSDALSEDDLPDDISELSRALEALEGETLGSSPGAPSIVGGGSGGLEDQLAERLGISPEATDPTAFAQQMAKLYNNLGLKMMERRKHEEALGLLRKAEAMVDNAAMWPCAAAHKRQRMQAITYNNLGCLFKRRNMPQVALQYLQQALALEQGGGPVQNSSSTHLNICAAYSALKRPKEALSHAEQAIILLQRHLWAHHLPFQEGLSCVVRQLLLPGASHHLLASANVLAMAYHNAAVEHEKLGRLREALVSFTRSYLISSKCLGPKAQMTTALSRALKAFQQRQARHLPTGAAHAARKAPSSLAARTAAAASQSKRGHSRGNSSKSAASSKSSSNLSTKALSAAAAVGSKATLPLDKGRTTGSSSSLGVRPPSSSRLASHLQQHHPPQA